MKIAFKKLGSLPLHFEVNSDNALFSGDLLMKKSNLAQLNGTITGSISIPCDLCAEEVENSLNEEITFYLSDGLYEGNDEELDVVEIDKSMIDLEELLKSEIELIKSDYFCCENCEGTSLDREF
ncbi:MAG: YceD family protein [Sulfuricurvum sp.]|uniref:YceD family protein n=1 Tax=Sulfuricurvum sp. TaxID=2025608 RepID=UPI0027338522|nr:YceD family protein [Sulfuricurvum sp.]MDP2850944.1 YceD family protein [Sulfuricurvum sp.]MDP3291258.1 YceD family protein [Sulfuricurvum sp.]